VFVVAGGLVMGLALGVRHAQGIFLVPITMDRAWSREAFGMAIAVQNLIWGLAQPFTGMIADRFGSVRVIIGGLLCYAAGLCLMAFAATPLEFTLTAGLCIGFGLSGTSFGVIYGALTRMVAPEHRSRALGLAGAVGGLGQFFMVPLTQSLIGLFGWIAALLILAVVSFAFIPCALPMRDHARTTAALGPEHTLTAALKEAFRHRGFWLLNIGFLACGFQLAFIAMHLPAYLFDRGLQAKDAVAGLAIIALTNVAGTYFCGLYGGLYRRKYLLCVLYLVRSLAMALFVLFPLSVWTLYPFCAVMGVIWLGTVPLTNGMISQMFGVRYITTLFGFVFFGHQLGAFFGVWLGGYVFDRTGSYNLIWFVGIALGLVAAALHFPIDDREIRRVVPAGAAL
jgi:predicted MFS family arabinose efflux permease